jgi:ectoine hydroxylase-related dioxygenase (phytanoyl-CoA dioxygenase family)
MWPGTHKDDLKIHEEKFNDDQGNLLTRGQTIENVPIEKTEPIILKAGQMSLHHPRIAHGSGINKSNKRRVGFVIQSYIGTNVEQIIGKVYVQQARGEDLFNYHEHTKRPVNTMEKENIDIRNKANEALSKIFYSGLSQKGKF